MHSGIFLFAEGLRSFLRNTGDQKITEPTNLRIKFLILIISLFQVAVVDLVHEILQQNFFPTMSWSAKEKAFCLEAYFANSSYKVGQAKFRRKFQCRYAPSNSRIFDWIHRFREYGTVENLNSKSLRDIYSSRTLSARTQRNISAARDSV